MDVKTQWICAYEKRLLQTFVCVGLGCFLVIAGWRHALLLCGVLAVVVLWVWIRRQSIEIVRGDLVLQDLAFSVPIGTSRVFTLGDGADVTLRVRRPRRGAPSTSRRVYVRRNGAITCHTMSLPETVASQLLDAIELAVGVRPSVVKC